jgi:hypothetical protein
MLPARVRPISRKVNGEKKAAVTGPMLQCSLVPGRSAARKRVAQGFLWLPERVRLPRLAFRQSHRFGEFRQRLGLGARREAS